MIDQKNISSAILGLVLALLILAPFGLQFAHSVEGHKHVSCKDVTTHIHEKTIDCSLCDFHFSTFDIQLTALPIFVNSEAFSILQIGVISSGKSTPNHHFLLRGPPFSV